MWPTPLTLNIFKSIKVEIQVHGMISWTYCGQIIIKSIISRRIQENTACFPNNNNTEVLICEEETMTGEEREKHWKEQQQGN